jgi:hypothetical protein
MAKIRNKQGLFRFESFGECSGLWEMVWEVVVVVALNWHCVNFDVVAIARVVIVVGNIYLSSSAFSRSIFSVSTPRNK